jgi:hypothetical protein
MDLFSRSASSNAAKVRDAFVDLFQLQPQIRVNNSVAFEQSKLALELAIVSRETEIVRDHTDTWLGSSKTIRIRARYRVKAGFDLGDKLQVVVTDKSVDIKVPKARILSVDPISTSVEELREGLWNKIQAGDLETELQAMPNLAREKEQALPDEAEQNFARLLSERLAGLAVHLEIQPDEPPIKSAR